jgi:hypothetical protein
MSSDKVGLKANLRKSNGLLDLQNCKWLRKTEDRDSLSKKACRSTGSIAKSPLAQLTSLMWGYFLGTSTRRAKSKRYVRG